MHRTIILSAMLFLLAAFQDAPEPINNHPEFSPDGTRIVFASNRFGNEEIALLDLASGTIERLTNSPLRDTYPTFSPDGKGVSYISWDGARFTISTYDLTTGETGIVVEDGNNYEPRYDAAGWRLVFTSRRDGGGSDIYLSAADGRFQRLLIGRPGGQGFASFSPDSHLVLFNSREGDFNQLMLLDLRNGDLGVLTSGDYSSDYGHISPDGTRIVFSSDRSEPGNLLAREIYLMDLDGGNIRRLTHNHDRDGYPKWSPDGSMITFHTTRDGNFEVYVMNADGTHQTRMTFGGGRE